MLFVFFFDSFWYDNIKNKLFNVILNNIFVINIDERCVKFYSFKYEVVELDIFCSKGNCICIEGMYNRFLIKN